MVASGDGDCRGRAAGVGRVLPGDQSTGSRSFSAKVLASNGASQSAGHGHGEAGAEAAHGGHGHGGDEPTVKTTLWANKIDIFLERPYAVAGKAIEPLFHVTVMKNGSPVTEGSLVFKATGPEQSRSKSVRRSRPGRGFSSLR